MENPFFAELYNGIDRYIEECRHGYKILIGNIGYSAGKEAELIAVFRREFFDGYIIVSNDPSGPEVRLLEKQGIPLVFAANDPAEIGREAAALLFRIIDGESGSGVTKVIEGRLVVRKSRAPPLGEQ